MRSNRDRPAQFAAARQAFDRQKVEQDGDVHLIDFKLGFEALSGRIEQRIAQGEAAADGGEAGVFDENLAGRLGRQAKRHLEVRQRHPGVDEGGAQDLVGRTGRWLQAVEDQAEIEARDCQVLAGKGKILR